MRGRHSNSPPKRPAGSTTPNGAIDAFLSLAAAAYDQVEFERGRDHLEQAHAALGDDGAIAAPVIARFVGQAIEMGAEDLLDTVVVERAAGSPECRARLAEVEAIRILDAEGTGDRPRPSV